MDATGINVGLLIIQMIPIILLIGLPIISVIDLGKRKLSGTTLALWVLIICAVPVIGSIAYWVVKPAPETK